MCKHPLLMTCPVLAPLALPSPHFPTPPHTFPQREDIQECIQEYADIAVWSVQQDVEGNPVVHLPPEDLMVS